MNDLIKNYASEFRNEITTFMNSLPITKENIDTFIYCGSIVAIAMLRSATINKTQITK